MTDENRPNLLVIFADQLRGQDLGCAGNPDVQTPWLDRLAGEGVRCSRTFANSPVCTPSRGTMLTGLYPQTHGAVVNDLALTTGQPTIATILRDAGYRTGYIGKWHLDGVPRTKFTPPGPRRQGFEFWAAYNCSHQYYRDDKFYRDDETPELVPGYEPAVQTDVACEFLQSRDDRPFSLFLSWGPPHDPYDQVPEEFRQLYDPQRLTLRENVREIDEKANRLARGLSPRETTANYYAAITALDIQVGRLMVTLEQEGLAENTLVIFTSDHGDMLFSQGVLKKQLPWEESVRIPLLLRWPAELAGGQVRDGLTSMVDLTPTVLGLLGVDAPDTMHGSNRSDLIRSGTGGADEVLLMDVVPVTESPMQGFDAWRGIRTDRYTYVESLGHEPWLLYDNIEDPFQLHNRIDDDDLAEVRKELRRRLHALLDEIGDSFGNGPDHLRQMGLAEAWNARERDMNPQSPDLI